MRRQSWGWGKRFGARAENFGIFETSARLNTRERECFIFENWRSCPDGYNPPREDGDDRVVPDTSIMAFVDYVEILMAIIEINNGARLRTG